MRFLPSYKTTISNKVSHLTVKIRRSPTSGVLIRLTLPNSNLQQCCLNTENNTTTILHKHVTSFAEKFAFTDIIAVVFIAKRLANSCLLSNRRHCRTELIVQVSVWLAQNITVIRRLLPEIFSFKGPSPPRSGPQVQLEVWGRCPSRKRIFGTRETHLMGTAQIYHVLSTS